jgi:hypothetical protein
MTIGLLTQHKEQLLKEYDELTAARAQVKRKLRAVEFLIWSNQNEERITALSCNSAPPCASALKP